MTVVPVASAEDVGETHSMFCLTLSSTIRKVSATGHPIVEPRSISCPIQHVG